MIEVSQRTNKFMELSPYDYHAKENDYIEVCEWSNGEGVDVTISSGTREQKFSFTFGEYEALQTLMLYRE
jgi:hypothetical protein